MGINFNSKFNSGKMISMSQKFKYVDSRERNPGPGAYLRFSEFGILVSKKAKNGEEKKGTKYRAKTEANEQPENNENDEYQFEDDKKPIQTEVSGTLQPRKSVEKTIENEEKKVEDDHQKNEKIENNNIKTEANEENKQNGDINQNEEKPLETE